MASAISKDKVLANKNILCSGFVLLCLSACGGGSDAVVESNFVSENESISSSSDASIQTATAQTGTVIIEERSGKTVIDAWFNIQTQQNITGFPANTAGDHCKIIDHKELTRFPNTQPVDTTLSLVSNAGSIGLTANQLGSVTVYTTEERWSDTPVSNDSMLMFESTSDFQQFSPLPLAALESFKWITPDAGVLDDLAGLIQWEPVQGDDTRIEINFSTYDRTTTNNSSVTVVCNLVDDGEFVLSAATQQILGNGNTPVVVRGLRLTQQRHVSEDTSLEVVQISHEI